MFKNTQASATLNQYRGSLRKKAILFLFCTSLGFTGCSSLENESGARRTQESLLRVGTAMPVKRANLLSDYYYNILARIMTHESLIRFDERMNPIPCLATRFESSRDGRTWTFELNPRAQWHDGKPVTVDDVAFTFRYIAEQNLDTQWISDSISHISTSADKVVFHLKQPGSRFLVNGGFIVHILPRHIWQNIKDARAAEGPGITIGSGPFILDAFDRPSGRISFRANSSYPDGAHRVNRVQFRLFSSLDVLALSLKKNETDVFFNYAATFPAPYAESLRQSRGLASIEADSMGIPALLGFNLKNKRTSRLNFRKAVACAIDYQRINNALMDGKGAAPGPGIIPLPFPDRENFEPWRQDLERSRQWLKTEGLADINGDGFLEDHEGRSISLSLLARTDIWGDHQTARLVAYDLSQIGIEVKIQAVDLSTWQAFVRQGRYDLLLFRTTPWGMMMHAGYGTGYFDSRTEGSAVCPVEDPSFSAICDAILRETRPEELAVLHRKIQRYYSSQLPAIALCWGKGLYPHSQNWTGFRLNYLEGGIINSLAWKSIQRNHAASGTAP